MIVSRAEVELPWATLRRPCPWGEEGAGAVPPPLCTGAPVGAAGTVSPHGSQQEPVGSTDRYSGNRSERLEKN